MSALARAIQRSFAAAEHHEPAVSAHHGLSRRRLGPAAIHAQALATVAPAAALVLFPAMLVRSGRPEQALALAVVAMLGMCCLGGTLALLTARISASGGIYSFVRLSLGRVPGVVVAVCLSVKYVGSAALSVHHLARTVHLGLGALGLPAPPLLVEPIVIMVVAALILVTVRSGVHRAATVLIIVELASLVFLLAVLLLAPIDRAPTSIPTTDGHLSYLVVTFVVFAMAGFESATFLGPESRRGPAAVTRVTWTTPVLCTGLLVLAGLATLDGRADVVVGAYLDPTGGGAPTVIAVAVNAALALSMLGSATASVNAVSRAWYALGLERVVGRRWAALHPVTRTPWRAVTLAAGLVAVIAVLVTSALPVAAEPTAVLRGALRIGLLIMYAAATVAAGVLLRRLDEHTAGSLVLVGAGTVLSLGMLTAVLTGELARHPVGTPVVLVGLLVVGPALLLVRRRRRRPGVYDRGDSRDALPGEAGVRRNRAGELVLTGRVERLGPVADDASPGAPTAGVDRS